MQTHIYALNHVMTINTVFMMISLMLDRYHATVCPFKKKLTFGQTLVIIASSWIVCYLKVALPLSFSFELLKGFWVDVKCVEKPGSTFVRI